MKYIASHAALALRKNCVVVLASLAGVSMASNVLAADAKAAPAAANPAQTATKPATAAADQALKIGFVNTEKILRDSAPAKNAQKKIENEFKKRDADLQALANNLRTKYEAFDKNAPVMGDTERAKAQRELGDLDTDLQRKRREFQEDFNRRRNEAFSTIVDKANQAIRDIAEKDNYDLILQDAVTVSARIDITEQVIEVLNKK